MAIVLLIMLALVLPAAMLFLTLSVNDFEKNTRSLAAVLQKRYQPDPPRKAASSGLPGSKPQGAPARDAGAPGRS